MSHNYFIVQSIRYFSLLFLISILSACGGHEYEGTWESSIGLADVVKVHTETQAFGPDFIETKSGRRKASFEVREFDGKTYLDVNEPNGKQQTFWVKNKNTLVKQDGLISIQYIRKQ